MPHDFYWFPYYSVGFRGWWSYFLLRYSLHRLLFPIWKYWLVQITAPGMYCVEDFAEEETNSCVFNLSVWDPDLNLNEMKFTGHDEMRVYLWGLLSLCFILSTMLDVPYAWLGLWGVFLVHLQGGSDWQLTSLRGGFPVDSVGPLQLP